MRNFKDVMKVSAVGVILLSALAACNSKPESNPTPPESDQVEVIIEQVVDGKVVDTRAVDRTDVVKYNGRSDGKDVAQIEWPDDVSSDQKFDFIYYAKPGLYLKAGGYRFNQTEDPRMTTFGIDTYGQTEAIKKVKQKVTCYPKGHKKIYVRLEYENINNPNKKSDYDYVVSFRSYPRQRRYSIYGYGAESATDLSRRYWGVYHRIRWEQLNSDAQPMDTEVIELLLKNDNSKMVAVSNLGNHNNYRDITNSPAWYKIENPEQNPNYGDVCFQITTITDNSARSIYKADVQRVSPGNFMIGGVTGGRESYEWFDSDDCIYPIGPSVNLKSGYAFLNMITASQPFVYGVRIGSYRTHRSKSEVPKVFVSSEARILPLKRPEMSYKIEAGYLAFYRR